MKLFIIASIIAALFFSCQPNQNAQTVQLPEGVHKITVKEVIQTSNYTYLRADENSAEKWLAVGKMEAKEGATYYYTGGFEMTDFESKELNKKFPSIFFLESVSDSPQLLTAKPVQEPHSTGKLNVEKQEVNVKPAEGGITIADLFAAKESYAGKTVKIRGQVTKYNQAIMKKNWVHIQDGTDFSGKFDLAATTEMETAVGETITLEGTVSLNKDFGYGYAYDVLLEDAKIVDNTVR